MYWVQNSVIRILVKCLHINRTNNDICEGHLSGIIGMILSHFTKVSLIFRVDKIACSLCELWLPEVTKSSKLYPRDGYMLHFQPSELFTSESEDNLPIHLEEELIANMLNN